jgi:hypothetical protein
MDDAKIFAIVFILTASVLGLAGLVYWTIESPEKVIVVETTETHRRINFVNDAAKIVARSSEKLRLALDPKFRGVTFSGYEISVKDHVLFHADCSGTAHQQSVFNSMREQFN